MVYRYELAEKLGSQGTCCLGVYLKEVKTRNNYGYGSMFGVPFILQVPKEGLDYDQLYQLILNRMKRCVKPSNEPEQAEVISNTNDCEMDSKENHEPSNDLENGNEVTPMETNGIETPSNIPRPKRLFSMDIVNSSGNTSINKLIQNNKISLSGMITAKLIDILDTRS